MSNLDIVIIGAGRIAHEHLKAINLVEGISASGVYSRTTESRREFAKKYSIKSFSGIDEVLESSPDGIIVAVSADQVFQLSKTLLPFKVPLLIEKPPGLSISEINRSIVSTETGRLAQAARTPPRTLSRLNSSRLPSCFTTTIGFICIRSEVENRRPQRIHSRRLLTPSTPTRESTTLVSSFSQNGHLNWNLRLVGPL